MKRGSASRSCNRVKSSPVYPASLVLTYFADVDETAHQILVAKRVDCVLCLLSRRVFHNPVDRVSHHDVGREWHAQDLPASLQCPDNQAQPVNPTSMQGNQKEKKTTRNQGVEKEPATSTHRRPPSTFRLEEVKHRQREPLQL